jgi:hypothetical protein
MTRAKVVVLPILLLCTLTLLVISNHARTSHAAETWDAMTVLTTITNAYYGNDDDKVCKALEVAVCPEARNVYTNRPQPHAKVFCLLDPKAPDGGLYAVGIFGLSYDQPVYVTGYAMSGLRKEKVCYRDQCAKINMSFLGTLLR